MAYEGVKFTPEMVSTQIPTDPRLEKLKYWCTLFHEKKLAPPYSGGSYGNLSFRLEPGKNSFIITASQSSLGETENDRFVTVNSIDLEKGIVNAEGIRQPSSEAMVHYAIYEARPDIQAIFHGHCESISSKAEQLGIPITSQEEESGTIELVNRVLEIAGDANFLEMKNHGFIALGTSLDEAGQLTLEMYEKSL